MTEKIITMPSADELFAAFTQALHEGTPAGKQMILTTFEPFLAKAKDHLSALFAPSASGLTLNLSKETGDAVLAGFVSSQAFLLRPLLKAALGTFGASTFHDFVASTTSGKNDPTTTIEGFVKIISILFEKLATTYAIAETPDTIATKIRAVFA